MGNNIANKVIIITGASSGLGEAAAKDLASNGAKLVLAARREEKLKNLKQEIWDAGGEAVYQVTDVSKKEEVAALVNYALQQYGQIDVLINNAGTMPGSFLYKNNTDEWDSLIDINIKGVLYGIGAVLPHMREQKSGHIINVASTAAHESVMPGATVYFTTKHAIRLISDGLRKEEAMAGSNIRVTNVSPGAIDTDLKYTVTDPDMRDAVLAAYNQNKLSPQEMARAIHYAISQEDNIVINDIVVRPVNY